MRDALNATPAPANNSAPTTAKPTPPRRRPRTRRSTNHTNLRGDRAHRPFSPIPPPLNHSPPPKVKTIGQIYETDEGFPTIQRVNPT